MAIKEKSIGRELTEKEVAEVSGAGFMDVVNNWTPIKTAWDFGKWTGDRVFGDILGWKKI